MPDILFLPECYADTALITMLLPPDIETDHSFGVFNVIKAMKSAQVEQPARKIVAIIDKDVTYKPKRRPPYFDDFIFTEAYNKVSCGQKAETNEYLIRLDKAVDSFLLWNAQEVEIDVNIYGFQSD